MMALFMSGALAGALGPGAEPSEATVQLTGRATATAGIHGVASGIGVGARWDPIEPVGVSGAIDWFAPGATATRIGARWRVASTAWPSGSLGAAIVGRGALLTRFTGRLDLATWGVGPAVHLRLGRLVVAGSLPVGTTWGGLRDPDAGPLRVDLFDASVALITGRRRQGTLSVTASTPWPVALITYRRRTAWGHWQVGVGLLSTLGLAAPLEVGRAWGATEP